jgi:endonuclease YncB( thermonuclease family)
VASVSEVGYTAPAFETGAFRLTVESTMKGSSLPSLGLPANPYGDWLVAVVYVHNWSDAPANLVMQNFGLVTANPTVSFMPLDSGTSLVGSTLGFELPLASTDSAVFMPGEGHRIGLLFTADPLGSGFSLEYGPAVVGLESSLVASPNATELGPPPPAPDLLEATVTDVVDGDTIMVDIDGVETTVTYIGVRAPAPDVCYGPEATAANAAIVAAGDAVYLEREATNESEDGALLRDVWIDLDGASVLVANELAAAGAVDVLSDTANDRFTAWLEVTVANAAFQGLGLWGACGGEVGETNREAAVAVRTIPRGSIALLPRPPALSG